MKLFSIQRSRNDISVLCLRIVMLLLIHSLMRILFLAFNTSSFPDISGLDFLRMMQGGLKFDISTILYLNILYIVVFLFPIPTKWKFSAIYQKVLKVIFIVFNTVGIAVNCIDIIYFQFIDKRTTYSVLRTLEEFDNMGSLGVRFLFDYWYITLIFIALITALIYGYNAVTPTYNKTKGQLYQYAKYTLCLALAGGLSVVGIRGGYRHSTRPINMSNAGKFVNTPDQMPIVQNSAFAILRNWGKSSYTHYEYFTDNASLEGTYTPVHSKTTKENNKTNVVVIILESFSREFVGHLNQDLDNGNYKGYTPFLDSLMQESFVCTQAYANGQKSIEALPSVLTSIPSLVLPYISSEHTNNRINSLASVLSQEGYHSSFFHGAANGSMGLQSFTKVIGFDEYYGRTEYNNEDDFDGLWGIWDEPYLQYFGKELGNLPRPFFSSIFTLSSHHPFKVPEEYEGVFDKGTKQIHQCVGYTDNALRKFFASIKNESWFDNTLFVFTADHSSSGTFSEYKNTVDKFDIPILFYMPSDSTMRGEYTAPAQQIDIMPSILDYVGVSHEYVAFGQSVFAKTPDKFAINYTNDMYQVIFEDKAIHFDGKETQRIFNHKSDPKGKIDLNLEDGSKKLINLTKAIVQQYNNRMIENKLTK